MNLKLVGFLAILLLSPAFAHAQLSGTVSSAEEGNMEGVLVSAKRDGTNKTITVVTDARGRYEFPADRLEAGKHTLTTRAAGYDLAKRAVVEVAAGANAQADLRLIKTRDIASQLTNAEWLHSMPGSDDQKRAFLGCVTCHTLERIVRSKYDTDGFLRTFARMATYANQSTPINPQRRLTGRDTEDRKSTRLNSSHMSESRMPSSA